MHRNPVATSRKRLSPLDAALAAASVLFVAAAVLGGLPGAGPGAATQIVDNTPPTG